MRGEIGRRFACSIRSASALLTLLTKHRPTEVSLSHQGALLRSEGVHDTLKCSLEKLSSLNPLAQPRLFAEFAGEKVKGNSLRFHSARANFVLRGCKISHQPIKQNTTAFFRTKRGVALQILANVMADARHKMPALLSGSRQHLMEERNNR